MEGGYLELTDDAFEEKVIRSNLPVLIDYWAEWCKPCRDFAPIFEEVAAEYQGRVAFMKLNIDKNPNTPSHYSVRGIPTLMLFKDGEVVSSKVGVLTKPQLIAFIDCNI